MDNYVMSIIQVGLLIFDGLLLAQYMDIVVSISESLLIHTHGTTTFFVKERDLVFSTLV